MEQVKLTQQADSQYRPEIQGVRAVGAFLIAVCHIWFVKVSGGVDVFFVVSGFLMSGVLLRQYNQTDSINVFGFWARIIRRITPSAYLIILLTLFGAMVWLPRPLWHGFIVEAVYTALHAENLHLMAASVDYLARDVPPSPVQQFWALSIQMQFYIVWPFVFLLAGWIAKKTASGIIPFAVALAAITLASLAFSILNTPSNPGAAYFNPATRIWEFAAGGLCAVLLPYISTTQLTRAICGWAGLLLILACAALLPRSVQFPGYVALVPVVGAVLILFAGTSGSRFGVDRFLSSRPLVALGSLSFTFYLWHWPVLVFFLEATGKTQAGFVDGLIIIAIALCGAYLTLRLIERPIGRSSFARAKTWQTYALGAVLGIPIVATASLWRDYVKDVDKETIAATRLPMAQQPVAEKLLALQKTATQIPNSQLISSKTNVPIAYHDGCQQRPMLAAVLACEYGQKTAPAKTIALVGSSHMTQWLPTFQLIARKHDLKLVLIAKSGCTFGAVEGTNESCRAWNANVIKKLAELHPDAVVVTSTRPVSAELRSPSGNYLVEYVPPEFIKQWKNVEALGISLLGLRDNPWFNTDIPTCVARHESTPLTCSLPRKSALLLDSPAIAVKSNFKDLELLDLTSYLCTDSICPVVAQNMLMYRDQHHISVPYAQSLAAPLEEQMLRKRPDLFDRSPTSAKLLAAKTNLPPQTKTGPD
ncbi:MAG TPA: acyltransferase family protein [Eoetvoesiella sp.]